VSDCSVLWLRNKPERHAGKLYITERFVCFHSEYDQQNFVVRSVPPRSPSI
jgi:hypothetical protein